MASPWPPSMPLFPNEPPFAQVLRPAGSTMRAGAVAEREGTDDEVPRRDALHVGPDVLDDADELMADRALRVRRVPAVVPEVGAANGSENDPNDGVRGLVDHGVRPLADLDRAGTVIDGRTHSLSLIT